MIRLHQGRITELSLSSIQTIGYGFLGCNKYLISISLPNVNIIGDYFLYWNRLLTDIELPSLMRIGLGYFKYNSPMKNEIKRII